jgi:hypothetical protein
MDGSRFDALSRALVAGHSRRGLTRVLSSLVLGGSLVVLGAAETVAKKKGKKRQKRRPAVPFCAGKADGTACGNGTVCLAGACACPGGTRDCGSGVCQQCCADSDCATFCIDGACAPCPRCYVLNAAAQCARTQAPMNGRCPCGFAESSGQCLKNGCRDCFENVGGICVPEPPGTAPNGPCACGFQDIGGICVPRYPLP